MRRVRCVVNLLATSAGVVAGPLCDAVWTPTFDQPYPLAEFVGALAYFDEDGDGPLQPALFAAGANFNMFGMQLEWIGRFRDEQWSVVGDGIVAYNGAFYDPTWPLMINLWHMAEFDADGDGPARSKLILTGGVWKAGEHKVGYIASWDGVAWEPVGTGDGLQGNTSYSYPSVEAMIVHDPDDDGPEQASLYVVGRRLATADGVEVRGCARWDGEQWSAVTALPSGLSALARFDLDGPGPQPTRLIAAGRFQPDEANDLIGVAWLNGDRWEPLGAATDVTANTEPGVRTLAVFDPDGHGPMMPALFAGGRFTPADGAASSMVARWDGVSWSVVDQGLPDDQSVMSKLIPFDPDGDGPALPRLYGYLGNPAFETSFVVWTGSQWIPTPGPMWHNIFEPPIPAWPLTAITIARPGEPPSLIIGGNFRRIAHLPRNILGELRGCGLDSAACAADINGDGVVSFTDINFLVGQFNTTNCSSPADLDGDCHIDFSDLNYVLAAFNQTCR